MRSSDCRSDVFSSDLPVRFFACVRNATDHLASHYNWLLSRGDQFDKGSHLNRIYSAMVGNGSTPEGVIQTLKEFPDLLNFQSGFLLTPGFDGSDNELDRKSTRLNSSH